MIKDIENQIEIVNRNKDIKMIKILKKLIIRN